MQKIKSILKTIRPLRSIHFMIMVFFGSFLSSFSLSYLFNLLFTILGMIGIFFAWQFNLIVNDIFDIEIDKISHEERILSKDLISRRNYVYIGVVYLSVSLVITCILGLLAQNFLPLIFVSLFMIMGYIYSGPPFRMRKYPFQTLFIGLGSFLAFYVGFFMGTFIILYRELIVSILIFVALSLGTVVKDYKDYEGDKKDNVNTIFTKYGLKTGSRICSVCLFVTFMIPLLLIFHPIDFLIIVPISIAVVLVFNWKKNPRKVELTFLFYFIVIAYVFIRYIGILLF